MTRKEKRLSEKPWITKSILVLLRSNKKRAAWTYYYYAYSELTIKLFCFMAKKTTIHITSILNLLYLKKLYLEEFFYKIR